MSVHEVHIPDVGDAKDVEVIEICVEIGQEVQLDDALLVIESDKASMELPAPVAGKVQSIPVKLGDIIDTGDLVLVLEVDEAAPDLKPTSETEVDGVQTVETGKLEPDSASERTPATPKSVKGESQGIESERFEVRLPELGDVDDVEVIEVLVQVGENVQIEQPLVVLESDKATMELPSPISGVVETLAVAVGDMVTDDSLIVTVRTGYDKAPPQDTEQSTTNESHLPGESQSTASMKSTSADENKTNDRSRSASVYAGPAVRRLARELGVELTAVEGSGVRGRIVKDDVKRYVKTTLQKPVDAKVATSLPEVSYPDFSKYGETETTPLSRMQARGADNLVRSWLNVVHVTQHDEADVTELEEFRSELNAGIQQDELRLTALAFVIKSCAATLREHPRFNASISPNLKSLTLKKYINIGMAVDTPQGLIVPVIRDVPEMGLRELAIEIESLSIAAREQKLKPDQIAGASFTVSSLGRIGGTGFTPIVNAPEVAILGVARLTTKPHWNGESFEPRQFLPLSLSYDHRAINGAEGGRFMHSLVEKLQDVRHLIL